jgi:glutamate racemase
MSDERPVGVFDSGVGGLSVLRAIRAELPGEDVVYVADSGHAPYGDRSREFIQQRSLEIVDFLRARGAKAVVVACNTATGAAVQTLRARFSCPIVAMEPAVKPAATSTRTGVVGVLATTRTLSSANFLRLADEHGARVRVLIQPCQGLVEQVERAELDTDRTRALLDRYLTRLVGQKADTLVLGCTHYAFLRPLIEEMVGPGVTLIDPSVPVARELKRRLDLAGLLSPCSEGGQVTFYTSGPLEPAGRVIARLWGGNPVVQTLPAGAPKA